MANAYKQHKHPLVVMYNNHAQYWAKFIAEYTILTQILAECPVLKHMCKTQIVVLLYFLPFFFEWNHLELLNELTLMLRAF